jgi:hypothetical protein
VSELLFDWDRPGGRAIYCSGHTGVARHNISGAIVSAGVGFRAEGPNARSGYSRSAFRGTPVRGVRFVPLRPLQRLLQKRDEARLGLWLDADRVGKAATR